MLRIHLAAHIIHAPRDSRTGGRRTPRHNMEPARDAGTGRDVGNRGRSLPPGWWIGAGLPLGLAFWTGVAWIMWRVL